MTISPAPAVNAHLPPHLREVCAILARGLVRLRSRAMDEKAPENRADGELRLHSVPPQRRHANPETRRLA